ncbi:GPI anchored CFEM domain protein C [Penicillium rolfsii]|nr:GPI anchored CFEM domain protein C [Penicillium rolfsii]
MKFTHFTLAAAALLVTVSAQGLDDLPACSTSCATSSIPASCGLSVPCICADKSFLSNIACCVADKCSQADQESMSLSDSDRMPEYSLTNVFLIAAATLQVAKGICSRGGVTDLPSTIACTSSASSSSGSTATTSTSSSSSQTKTGSAEATGTNTTLSGTVLTTKTSASTTESATSSSSSSASSASSASKSASSAAATTNAAVLGQNHESSLMAAAGAAAAFAMFV